MEGEESYTLSLVSADNNADISPTNGEAVVIILADPGAGGVIAVKEDSQQVGMVSPKTWHRPPFPE